MTSKAPIKIGNDAKKIIDGIDVFIFDCDGVIWKGDSLIKGVPAVLDDLRKLGKRIFFVTNNSTKSRLRCFDQNISLLINPQKGIFKKVSKPRTEYRARRYEIIFLVCLYFTFGVLEIFSSSFAAAAYLEKFPLPPGKKVNWLSLPASTASI